jgi:hypothetical protein
MAKKKKARRVALPKRNLAAKQATNQKAGVIPDKKKTRRGGARNTMREDLSQVD